MDCWYLGVNLILLVVLYKLTLIPVSPHLHNNRNVEIFKLWPLQNYSYPYEKLSMPLNFSKDRLGIILCLVTGFVQVSTKALVHLSVKRTSINQSFQSFHAIVISSSQLGLKIDSRTWKQFVHSSTLVVMSWNRYTCDSQTTYSVPEIGQMTLNWLFSYETFLP